MAFVPTVQHIQKARFVVNPFTPQRMAEIAAPVAKSIVDRIYRGENLNDLPAKPLSARYARAKQIKGRQPIRNWVWGGYTLAALHVLDTRDNQALIGFSDPLSNKKAYINNAREQQFGTSRRDLDEFHRQVMSKPIVTVKVENG
jgi:hypothetical protein